MDDKLVAALWLIVGPCGSATTTEVPMVLPKYRLRAHQRPSLGDEGSVLSVRTKLWDL